MDLDDNNELVEIAKRFNAVSNSHEWLDSLVTRMGKSEEIILYKIVNMVSDHEKWGNYVHELREYLIKRKEILDVYKRQISDTTESSATLQTVSAF